MKKFILLASLAVLGIIFSACAVPGRLEGTYPQDDKIAGEKEYDALEDRDYKVIKRISLPADTEKIGYLTFSPDGSKIAYMVQINGRQSIWVNGERVSVDFDEVKPPLFSPDGSKVAYRGRTNKKWSLWINNRAVSPELCRIDKLVFSPDSKKIAYMGGCGPDSWYMWLNEQKISPRGWGGVGPTFNADGSKVVYTLTEYLGSKVVVSGHQLKVYIWINDQKLSPAPELEWINKPIFTPDGNKVVYVAGRRRDESFLWIDDKLISPEFNHISSPVFSSDGSRVFYVAEKSGFFSRNYSLWANDKRISPEAVDINACLHFHLNNPLEFISFTPNGNKATYFGEKNGKYTAYINDQKISPEFEWSGGTYHPRNPPVFSPDGAKIAYKVYTPTGWGAACSVWINDQRVSPLFNERTFGKKQSHSPDFLFFNSDGTKLAYPVYYSGKTSFWINDRCVSPGFEGSSIDIFPVNINPEGTKVAYIKFANRRGVVDLAAAVALAPLAASNVGSLFAGDLYRAASSTGKKTVHDSWTVWANDRKVSPDFDIGVIIDEGRFKKTGELIFAGFDWKNWMILQGQALLTESPKK